MSSLGVSVGVEAANINSTLNSVVLCIFLTGMYTVIYFGTIYVYSAKNTSKYHPVSATITVLFLSIIAQIAFQWYITKWQFVDNGVNRESVYLSMLQMPSWLHVALNTSNFIIFVIADALLIWRCFYVWNRSWRIISLPLFLLVTETALFLFEIVIDTTIINGTVSLAFAAKLNAVVATAFFVSFGTTLVSTLLIAYRIYAVAKEAGASTRRFQHVVDIVVQSGAVYALSQLAGAISLVVPGANTLTNTRDYAFQNYALLVNFPIAGMTTTVMVARVALLADDSTYPSSSVQLSGLQFNARSVQPAGTVEAMEFAHSVDGEKSSASEGQAVEDKGL